MVSPARYRRAKKFLTPRKQFTRGAKIALCLIGLGLFASNPFRDLAFFEDIPHHEGFPTFEDTIIVGFVRISMATVMVFPAAIFLIVYGIGHSQRLSLLPRFDRLTWIWGILATVLACLMVDVEMKYVFYGIHYAHHWDTVAISLLYMAFIYVWWCCSLSHGDGMTASATRDFVSVRPKNSFPSAKS